jgi:hypothetical protein
MTRSCGCSTPNAKTWFYLGLHPSPHYGIREEAVLLQDFTENLVDYARFIDDGIGLWDTAAGPNPIRAWARF